jgi:hypothetical protein
MPMMMSRTHPKMNFGYQIRCRCCRHCLRETVPTVVGSDAVDGDAGAAVVVMVVSGVSAPVC